MNGAVEVRKNEGLGKTAQLFIFAVALGDKGAEAHGDETRGSEG